MTYKAFYRCSEHQLPIRLFCQYSKRPSFLFKKKITKKNNNTAASIGNDPNDLFVAFKDVLWHVLFHYGTSSDNIIMHLRRELVSERKCKFAYWEWQNVFCTSCSILSYTYHYQKLLLKYEYMLQLCQKFTGMISWHKFVLEIYLI